MSTKIEKSFTAALSVSKKHLPIWNIMREVSDYTGKPMTALIFESLGEYATNHKNEIKQILIDAKKAEKKSNKKAVKNAIDELISV
jgi:hypothetical protein